MCWEIISTISHVIVTTISVFQAMISCYILLLVSIVVFYLGKVVDSIDKYASILDFIMGTDFSDQINGIAGFLTLLVMSIAVGQFIICVLLCKGLCENKPWLILPYITCGSVLLGFRVRLVLSGYLDQSQMDDGVRFCYCYGGYLLFMFIHCVERVQKKRKQEKSAALQYQSHCA